MLLTTIKKSVLCAALAVASLLGAGAAQAITVVGRFDPEFGPDPVALKDLGWAATVKFEVPASCTTSGLQSTVCPGFDMLSATLEFYNIGAPGTILETFTLDTSVAIGVITFDGGGMLTGVTTNYFTPVVPNGGSLGIAGNGAYAFSLSLFQLGGLGYAQLTAINPATGSPPCRDSGVTCEDSDNASRGVFTVQVVPEPPTTALMLAALGGVAFMARRRRQQG